MPPTLGVIMQCGLMKKVNCAEETESHINSMLVDNDSQQV